MSETSVKISLTADNHASPAIHALLADVQRLKRELRGAFSPAASNAFASKITADAARMKAAFAGLNQVQRRFVDGISAGTAASAHSFTAMRRQARSYITDRARMDRTMFQLRRRGINATDQSERQAHRTRLAEMRQRGRLDAQLHGAAMARARQLGRFSGRLAYRPGNTSFPSPVAGLAGTGAAVWATKSVLERETGTDAAEIDARTYAGLSQADARKLREQWAMPAAVDFGATAEDMLRSFTDAVKAGIPQKGAKAFTDLSVQAGEAWGKPLQETTDFLANVNTIIGGFGDKFDAKKLRSVSNTLTFLAKEMSTSPDKLMTFAEKGAGAAMAMKMSQEAGLAFGAASTSAGNQAGASGRMFDALSGFFNVRLQDLTKRGADGADSDLARQMLRKLGYGSYDAMLRTRNADPDSFLFDFVERFTSRITDQKQRASFGELITGQEWAGEFGRLLDNPAILKEARKALRESKGADTLSEVWRLHIQKLRFLWKQVKAGFDNLLGEFGMVLSPIAAKIGGAFVQWTEKLSGPNGIQRHVQRFVDGLMQGFFGGDLDAVLKRLSTAGGIDPEAIFHFAKGFAEGLREVWSVFKQIGQGIAKVIGVDASTAEGAGKLIGSILGLSAALVFLRPVVGVLDLLAAGVGVLTTALTTASGLGLGGTAAAGGGAAAWLTPWLAGLTAAGVIAGAALMKWQGDKLKNKPVKPNTPADYLLRWRDHNIRAREMTAADHRKDDAIPTMSFYDREQTAKRGMNPWRPKPTTIDADAPKFARGGRFTVGGAGGTDSKLVQFWASPGETVSVHTPDQVNGGGGLLINLRTAGVEDRLSDMVRALLGLGDRYREAAAKAHLAAAAAGSAVVSGFVSAAAEGTSIVPSLPGGGGATLGKTGYGKRFYYPNIAPGERGTTAPMLKGAASANAKAAFDFLTKDKGLTRDAAAGILASIKAESGFNPAARGDGGSAHGIFQHHADRRAKILRGTGVNMSSASFMDQMRAGIWEAETGSDPQGRRAWEALKSGKLSAAQAAAAWSDLYERPLHKRAEAAERGALANGFAKLFGAGNATTVPSDAAVTGARAALTMTNRGATRNHPITTYLSDKIRESVAAVYGRGYRVEVFSGGQDAKGAGGKRTGSTRHDDHGQGGEAADLYVIGPDGKRLRGADLAKLGQYWRAKKYGGVGLEMAGGGIHLDQHKNRAGHWWYSEASRRIGERQIDQGERGILPCLMHLLFGSPSAASLASTVNTPERVIQNVPTPTLRAAQPGSSGSRAEAPAFTVNINGANQSPEQIAAAVQKHVTRAWNWRTHDVEHDLT